jgi:hypothetical protein
MRGNKNRVLGGARFEHTSNPKGGSKWWVERTDGAANIGKKDVM